MRNRKYFHLIFLIVVSATLSSAELRTSAKPPAAEMRTVINREYLPAVLEMIRSAQKSIHVIQYEYVHYGAVRQIESALIDAVRRGVRVRMILDDSVEQSKKSIDRLEKNGIDVKLDETFSYGEAGDKKTHAKAILVDGEKFILGSTNFSAKSIENNNEANLYIVSSEAGKRFKDYFEQLWKNASAEPGTPPARIGDADIIFNRQYLPAVLDLFQNAKKRIYIVLYGMNLDRRGSSIRRLADELKNAKTRGVDVRIVLDQSAGSFAEKTLEFNEEAKRYFEKAGIELRLDSKEVITHAKVLIVDDAAVVGGTNWGHGPLDLYNDCNAVVRRPEIVRRFSDMFLKLWSGKNLGSLLSPATGHDVIRAIESHRGRKAVIVNVWATWCIPCVEEFPILVRLKQSHPDNLHVIFVSADFPKDESKVIGFLKSQGVTWETFLKSESDQAFISAMGEEWSGALPATFIFSKSGRRIFFHEGGLPAEGFDPHVKQAIES